MHQNGTLTQAKNVLGTTLQACCYEPLTGYFRDGYCRTDARDLGSHVVCAVMTEAFLRYTAARGNDLSTPRPEYQFPGLQPGDKWCLCVSRWKEAYEAGVAPRVYLPACHEGALRVVSLKELQEHAID